MKFTKARFLALLIVLMIFGSLLQARTVTGESPDKKLDLANWHSVGNIWLRVSNYGFFGSGGDTTPPWPSLEYPGGSGIDYLYRGALWFGAKKQRRDGFGRKYYWLDPNTTNEEDIVAEGDTLNGFEDEMLDWPVVDTLVSVGFDGDLDLKEFLPAYNSLETSPLGSQYAQYNSSDVTISTSIRDQRRGIDDDGDGLVDEDPIGYAFPFRENASELPTEFQGYAGLYPHEFENVDPILNNTHLWFPLGFVDLSQDPSNGLFNLAQAHNDDGDSQTDEDGFPVSEQDFISYYYDYSPFGTPGERDWGGSRTQTAHVPLNVRVRQLSYQWSYEHIKNLVYIEFDVTNMNELDTLYDCSMGIYMDSDVGPQAWGGSTIATDDVSSFVPGQGYQFAYTYDADGDGGLTTGYVGSRVCSPDPDQLEFACWFWKVGDGPDDSDPLDLTPTGPTANQKYWLLTNQNPDDSKYKPLLTGDTSPTEDTRYLFGFYGAQAHTGDTDLEGEDGFGEDDYMETDEDGNYFKRWNLAPYNTMKIVLAVFPGDNVSHLKIQSLWAKSIYGQSQGLSEVVLPDTITHYVGPEPPAIPEMYARNVDDGNRIEVFWDNRSEIDNLDFTFVDNANVGWQDFDSSLDSYIGRYDEQLAAYGYFPENYAPPVSSIDYNDNAVVNPWTAYRLRHDFQGYTLWGRSGSGSQDDWMHMEKWDINENDQQLYTDFMVNNGSEFFIDFGGVDLGIEKGLPSPHDAEEVDTQYYKLNGLFELVPIQVGEEIYGDPLYNPELTLTSELAANLALLSFDEQALAFKHPSVDEDVYMEIYDDRVIPLLGHGGANNINPDGTEVQSSIMNRLSRRYYSSSIPNPPRGVEYYVAVTAWDRGMPYIPLSPLESGRDEDANMKVLFPGANAKDDMDDIYVVPNPYIAQSNFDGKRDNDDKGDKSRRIWFVNLPETCTIKIFTLAGDLVDTIKHNGAEMEDVITVSKASYFGLKASGMATWDLLSENNQIIAPGVYLYSVKSDGDVKVGKFVIIK